MKKSISAIALTTLLISMLSVAVNIQPAKPQVFQTIYVAPPENIFYSSTTTVNTTFTISVAIKDASNVAGIQFRLEWNNTLLNCESFTLPSGHFMDPLGKETSAGNLWIIKKIKGAGYIEYAVAYYSLAAAKGLGTVPRSGSGALAELTMKIVRAAPISTPLKFSNVLVGDPDANPLPTEVEDSNFYYLLTPIQNLNTGMQYFTIQAAINAIDTLNGHTIFVHSGIYYENIVVSKAISLVGEDRRTTIVDGYGGTAITLETSNITISDFTTTNGACGILVADSSNNNTIKNCIFSTNSIGIFLNTSSWNIIYHNSLVNNTNQLSPEGLSSNFWDNGCEGNYWSDYNGADLDGDGVGDTKLPWRGVDSFPLMSLYVEGNVNHDAWVNILDALQMGNAFGSNSQSTNWNAYCDLNEDGEINILDALILTAHFGEESF